MLTVNQAAAELGLSERRVRELCQSGALRAQTAGRRLYLIPRRSLVAYRQRTAAAPRGRGRPPKILSQVGEKSG